MKCQVLLKTHLSHFCWRHTKPITDEGIDQLMRKVYEKIEKEALKIYRSNDAWALKAYCYTHILPDVICSEENLPMVEELMSPVFEWQQESFDPLAHFRKRLERNSRRTREAYMHFAARFVLKEGKKAVYTDEDIEDYQTQAMKRYSNDNSYYQEMRRLLLFLRSLPGGKERELPLGLPKPPKKSRLYRPIASIEDIETLIWACVIDDVPADMVVRLIGATVYGRRRSELVEFKVHLNGAHSTIEFPISKRGEECVPYPIPQALVPLFDTTISDWHPHTLDRRFKKLCQEVGVSLPKQAGIHWLRRRVATTVRKVCNSDIDAYRFMRWAEPRELGMLAYYDQTRYEETDVSILEKHPIVRMWEEVAPYLLELNSSYKGMLNNT